MSRSILEEWLEAMVARRRKNSQERDKRDSARLEARGWKCTPPGKPRRVARPVLVADKGEPCLTGLAIDPKAEGVGNLGS